MKKNYISFLLCIFAVTNCFGQSTFQETINAGYVSVANAVQQTTDGGYIMAGYVEITDTNNYYSYLVKTNANGGTMWTKYFAAPSDAEAYSVQQTSDSGYIVACTATDTSFNYDLCLIKTNAFGDTLWTRTYDGVSDMEARSVQQTMDGGYIATGFTDDYETGYYDVYLIKTDANGDSIWTRTYGGNSNAFGECVRQTSDSGYIIVGYTLGFGAGNSDVYLIKTNSKGDTLWTKTYGGGIDDIGLSVQQTPDQGYIIAGETNSYGAGGYDCYLIKTNLNGDTLWTKTYGGPFDDVANEVHHTTDGGYIIAGTTSSFDNLSDDVYLIKINANGDTLWTKTYGGTLLDDGISAEQTTDGGYVIAGYTYSFPSDSDYSSVYLVKTDLFGNTHCNQGSPPTEVHATGTQTSSTNTVIFYGGTPIVTTTVVGSAGSDSTLCIGPLGVDKINNNTLSIYPNPVENQLTIRTYNFTGKNTLYIINTLGEILKTEVGSQNTERTLDVKDLSTGIYFIKICNENESIVAKFVKE